MLRILLAHLGDHREAARELLDVAQLLDFRELDRAVRDLEIFAPHVPGPVGQAIHAALLVGELEEGAAEPEGDAALAQEVDLAREVLGHQCGAPAELDEIDDRARRLDVAFEL